MILSSATLSRPGTGRWNDTLSILHTRGGVVVASEPYDDDPGWADVPDHHLVDVADGVVTVTELEA
jgi:gamma-glutamyl hercynylcysteine S-oxide hydrolase